MSLRVAHADGTPVAFDGGVLRLEEDRRYFLAVAAGVSTPSARLDARELAWNAEYARFSLDVGFWAGSAKLQIQDGAEEREIPVEVSPRPEKLEERQWLALLADLEAWSPGASLGLAGGGVGAIGSEGARAPVLAVALLPLVPALVRAVRAILAAPRELTVAARTDVPLHKVRRADRETLSWLARHARTAAAVDPWQVAAQSLRDPRVPQDTSHETVDHPVNRYLAWLVRRIERVLRDLAEALKRASRGRDVQEDTVAWCEARAAACARGADDLSNLRRSTFLGRLTPAPATEAALLAVQDDPAYARAHALARPFLSGRFRLRETPDGGEAPVRPSFDLYELWTLLAVQRSLEQALPRWAWTWYPTPGNELLAGFGRSACFFADGPEEQRIEIGYNITFRSHLTQGSWGRFSISGERRPDIVITQRAPGEAPSWVVLDAKYRVSRESLADAFTSLHVYRDALRIPRYGGACRGGLLLVPAADPACAPWFEDAFRREFGIGAWQLTPGDEVGARLGASVLAMLGVDAEAQREADGADRAPASTHPLQVVHVRPAVPPTGSVVAEPEAPPGG